MTSQNKQKMPADSRPASRGASYSGQSMKSRCRLLKKASTFGRNVRKSSSRTVLRGQVYKRPVPAHFFPPRLEGMDTEVVAMAGVRPQQLTGCRSTFRWSDEASSQQYGVGSEMAPTHHGNTRAVRPSSAEVIWRRSGRHWREGPCHPAPRFVSRGNLRGLRLRRRRGWRCRRLGWWQGGG